MCPGRLFEESAIKLSRIQTGELSRIEFCLQPGKSTARLYATSPRIMQRPTMPPTHGRHLLSDVDDQEGS